MKKEININKARYDIIPEDKNIHKGKTVLCITTGEVFRSAKEAANHYDGVSYTSLIQCLTGRQNTCGGGTKNVNGKGLQFCYVSEMGYKANDIADYIVELKAKADANMAYMKAIQDTYNQFMEVKAKQEKEMQEMLHKMMTLVG